MKSIPQKVKVAWVIIAVAALILKVMCTRTPETAIVASTSNIVANEKELPIYCVNTDQKKVALSFDAAWGAEDTIQILDILDKQNIKVTFFMTGGWVEKNPDMVKEIYARGHDLGNHSENHKQMSKLTAEQNKSEVQLVHDKVKALTGYDMFLFRPPYGDYDSEMIKTIKEMGYYPIQWSVDSLDWKDYGRNDIIKRVAEHKALDNGAIILCHNGAKYTASALDEMITKVKEKGYEFVPISQLIIKDGYHIDTTGKQIGD